MRPGVRALACNYLNSDFFLFFSVEVPERAVSFAMLKEPHLPGEWRLSAIPPTDRFNKIRR